MTGFLTKLKHLISGGEDAAPRYREPRSRETMTATMSQTTLASLPQLPNHRVKFKKPMQRACNEADAKGKICAGHLKRWFYAADVVEQACGDVRSVLGENAEVYRCEKCRTLYFPSTQEPRGKNVAGVGGKSDFGLTLPPKAAEAAKPAEAAAKATETTAKPAGAVAQADAAAKVEGDSKP